MKLKLRNAARASRSMNIDRKKAPKRRQGLTFHEHWSKKATKRRQGLTFHENRSILKSLGITEKSDREIDNGISPMRLFSFQKMHSRILMIIQITLDKMHSLKENKRIGEIPARASRSMNIDRKKAPKRRQGLTFHEHSSEKSSETPPGPHVPWTLIEKSYETPPGPHVPWKSIDFEKSWDHWKEW